MVNLFKLVKGLMNQESFIDDRTAFEVNAYAEVQKMFPDGEPHEFLAMMEMAEPVGRGKYPDETLMRNALSETFKYSCIAPPNNARAYGLFVAHQELPSSIKNYPKFGVEYEQLMAPVYNAVESEKIHELYKRFNPQMAAKGFSSVLNCSIQHIIPEFGMYGNASLSSRLENEQFKKTSKSRLVNGMLPCVSCAQMLNVPPNKLLDVSCPKCNAEWRHDGR